VFDAEFAARHWYRRDRPSPLSLLLLPLALLFRFLVALRRTAYGLGLLRSIRLSVPVIVSGNLTVGGSGKTPLVLALSRALTKRGMQPGIVSRGYGGTHQGPKAVTAKDDVMDVGDEPLLLAKKSACPVWVGRDRAAAGAALLAQHPECDVLILDDGLQHYRLARDVEIAVEDERGCGNGLMLPAGPLREPAGRKVDATVVNGPARAGTYPMRLQFRRIYRLDQPGIEVAPGQLAGRRLHAVAGIGNPARFFALLDSLHLKCTLHAFADHHPFRPEDMSFADCDAVLMTEKDAVKCVGFGRNDLYALEVEAEVDPALVDFILDRLHGRPPA
jgi:tetraacyldisaccharide 4'-kinase